MIGGERFEKNQGIGIDRCSKMSHSQSHIPTRTSAKTVEEIVSYVGGYFRLPITCRLEENTGPLIDMRQSAIVLPMWLTKANSPKIFFVVTHECGHVVVFPKTAHQSIYYEAWARQIGVKDAKRFLNILADQLVNNACMEETPFKEEVIEGCADFYKPKRRRAQTDAERWHFQNSYRRVQEIRGKRMMPFKNEREKRLYALVFHDEREFDKRFPEIAELARDWFDNVRWAPQAFLPSIDDPEEFENWLKKIGQLRKECVLDTLRSQPSRRLLMDYIELASFDEWIIAQSNAEKKAKERSGRGEMLDVWSTDDRVSELEMQRTIQTHGVFIPSVTALKYTSGAEDAERVMGVGLQASIVDQSGSMLDSIDLVALICFASIKHAEARGDEIALLSFSGPSEPKFHLKPTRNYAAARPILEEIQASGSTHLSPALKWLVEHCQPRRLKPTAIIFSDTMIADEQDSLVWLKTISEIGGTTIIVSTFSPASDWVQVAQRDLGAQCFTVDYENLGNIQQILKCVIG
jgi:Mg-chelatase subunit ChlD